MSSIQTSKHSKRRFYIITGAAILFFGGSFFWYKTYQSSAIKHKNNKQIFVPKPKPKIKRISNFETLFDINNAKEDREMILILSHWYDNFILTDNSLNNLKTVINLIIEFSTKFIIFDMYYKRYVNLVNNEEKRFQKIESKMNIIYDYDPTDNIILSSRNISKLPNIRVFFQQIPTSIYFGVINKCNNKLCEENILSKRENEDKILYGNYKSNGFSGLSVLVEGTFYVNDNKSSLGYKTDKKFDEGIKNGDTIIIKYNKTENELEFFKQKYANYNSKIMELMYKTNKINKDYYYCIGYRHDKGERNRKFSYIVTIPTN
eukprot:50841_1